MTCGAAVDVKFHHLANIHPIDVIGAEDRHHVRLGLFNEIDVLVNGVGGSSIPVLAQGTHLRGNRDDEMISQQAGRLPSLAQVLQQRLALELNQDVDGIDSRVDQVAEDEVDNPITAAKWDGRLGTLFGERIEARPLTPGQHKRKHSQLHFERFSGGADNQAALAYFGRRRVEQGRATTLGRFPGVAARMRHLICACDSTRGLVR